MNTPYVLVIGSLNYDMLFQQDRLPMRGETYTANGVSFCAGGKGANQAVQCAKLGVKTYMVGKVGRDSFGVFLKESLAGYGADVSNVWESGINTGVAGVNVLSDGSVHATIATGANFDMSAADLDRVDDLLRGSSMLVLQMEIPTPVVEEAINRASAYGVPVLLNAAPAKPISAEVLKKVNCFVVNESEASFYAGEEISDRESAEKHAEKLLAMVNGTLVITLGKHGSLLCNAKGRDFFPADRTVKVLETTGAGDSYIGGFVHAKLGGASDGEACRFAARVADRTVARVGAQPAMPTLQELNNIEKFS